MPTYDYLCESCGHELEIFQSMTEGHKRKCPACGTLKLRRLIGAGAAIMFKGSGFYETDYRSKSYHEAKAADEKAGAGGAQDSSSSKTSDKSKTSDHSKQSDNQKKSNKSDKSDKSDGAKGSCAKDSSGGD